MGKRKKKPGDAAARDASLLRLGWLTSQSIGVSSFSLSLSYPLPITFMCLPESDQMKIENPATCRIAMGMTLCLYALTSLVLPWCVCTGNKFCFAMGVACFRWWCVRVQYWSPGRKSISPILAFVIAASMMVSWAAWINCIASGLRLLESSRQAEELHRALWEQCLDACERRKPKNAFM